MSRVLVRLGYGTALVCLLGFDIRMNLEINPVLVLKTYTSVGWNSFQMICIFEGKYLTYIECSH